MADDISIFNQLPQYFHLEESDHMDKPIDVEVTGEVPTWINGSLFRDGPGLFKIGPTVWNNLFDGYAVLQRWTIRDGKVTYQASILDSENYKKSAKHRRIVGEGIGCHFPDPCDTLFRRLFNRFIPSQPVNDNTNVNFIEIGDRIFAMTESPSINEINPDSLTVKQKSEMNDYINVHTGTAHPHKLKDGTVIYFGTNVNFSKSYNFISIPPQPDPAKSPFENAKVIATVPSRWKLNIGYTHSFGMTENFFVHLELPLTINIPRAMVYKQLGMEGADILIPHEGESMDILLVDRTAGKRLPVTYKAPEGIVFHFINCYEESNHVVCDVCFIPKGAKIVQRAYLHHLLEDLTVGFPFKAKYARFVLPLSLHEAEEGENLVSLPGTTATAVLEKGSKNVVCVTPEFFKDGIAADFPAINYDYNGTKHRYCYAFSNVSPSENMLTKFDCLEKTIKTYEVGANFTPGEPVFIASPDSTREDDGVILSTITAVNSSVQSYLVVLDASTFEEIARASLPIDRKVSVTFHGIFTDKKFNA
ncbi:hypothetical protein EGW08_001706 [Elysia chlorotica]|uniref:Uncharacterized protein n=1 Tax=Elysia chlorotica TaxID=188477 RepID=A0A3S1BSK9_ELYCH|nr:hypothetical protein EGW08_001706 [Elysia chlorotica]